MNFSGMNLPNKLTMLRILMVPVMVLFLALEPKIGRAGDIVALILFIAASVTDYFDGKIARKYHLITDFGKFMDPLADKLLVCSAAVCLISLGRIPAWVVVILIGREFVISGFRLIAVEKGVVIAANMWGKIKTVCQMAMTIVLIANFSAAWWQVLGQILIWASLILTILSLVFYLYQNRSIIADAAG